MKYEFFKLYVKRKAWLLIAIFMVIRLFSIALQQNYYRDIKMDQYYDSYMQHMEILEGALDDEKERYISNQNQRIAEMIEMDPVAIENAYINHEITEDAFDVQMSQYQNGMKYKEEFSVINARYQNVSNNPERIYFMYTNGWVGFLGNERLDYVLLILLSLIVVPMICNEYATGMYPILRLTIHGKEHLYLSKCITAIVTVIGCVVLFFVEELIYYALVFKLPNGDFPLQSLPTYENSPYLINIQTAALLMLANRCFGAIYLTILLICFSSLLKRALSAVFLGLITILFPFILFSGSTVKYCFPSPLGFFLSCGFLEGSYHASLYSQDMITITPQEYFLTVCFSLGIMLLLLLIGMAVFTGKTVTRRKKILSIMVLPMMLCGCSDSVQEPSTDFGDFIFNQSAYQPVTPNYQVIRDPEMGLCMQFHENETPIPLIRNCFQNSTDYRYGILTYIDDDIIYYVNQYGIFHYAVIALDTRDFSERIVHEVEWSDNTDKFDMLFGLGLYLPAKQAKEEHPVSFFVQDNQLVILKNYGIYWYDLNSDWNMQVYDGLARNLAYASGSIYYIDELKNLICFDLHTKSSRILPLGKIAYFYATNNGIYFNDLLDHQLYKASLYGEHKTLADDFDEDAFRGRETS